MKRFLAAVLLSVLLDGCVTYPAYDAGGAPPPPPHGITARSGAEQARRDLAAGQVRVMEAGTIGTYAPGVPEGPRWDKIPRRRLPNGCTNPSASKWMEYARGYNAVVVARLAESSGA